MTTEKKYDGCTPSVSGAELGRVSEYDHPDHGWKWRACEVRWIEARIAAVAEEIARKHEKLAADVERCYRMLLSEPDTKGALFKAENILREALTEAKAKTPNVGGNRRRALKVREAPEPHGVRLNNPVRREAPKRGNV